MRSVKFSLVLTAALTASIAQASDSLPMEKVKMGILPVGGLYEMFDVACNDQSTATVVSTERRRRWCTQFDGQLSCFKGPQEASHAACSTETVASSQVSGESFN